MAEICELTQPKAPVYVCTGSDCRKKSPELAALKAALATEASVCEVKCQKICSGPVVGLEVNGRVEWFAKMVGAKSRSQLVQLLRTGDLKKRLRARIIKKRRGKLRGSPKVAPKAA